MVEETGVVVGLGCVGRKSAIICRAPVNTTTTRTSTLYLFVLDFGHLEGLFYEHVILARLYTRTRLHHLSNALDNGYRCC